MSIVRLACPHFLAHAGIFRLTDKRPFYGFSFVFEPFSVASIGFSPGFVMFLFYFYNWPLDFGLEERRLASPKPDQ